MTTVCPLNERAISRKGVDGCEQGEAICAKPGKSFTWLGELKHVILLTGRSTTVDSEGAKL
jgi:hypothetical protein